MPRVFGSLHRPRVCNAGRQQPSSQWPPSCHEPRRGRPGVAGPPSWVLTWNPGHDSKAVVTAAGRKRGDAVGGILIRTDAKKEETSATKQLFPTRNNEGLLSIVRHNTGACIRPQLGR